MDEKRKKKIMFVVFELALYLKTIFKDYPGGP